MSDPTNPSPGTGPRNFASHDQTPMSLRAEAGATTAGAAGARIDESQAIPQHHDLLRLCRHCSTQTVTTEPNCPGCGTPYVHEPWLNKTRMIAIGTLLLLVLVSVGAVTLMRNRQEQAAQDQRMAEQQAAADEQARQAAAKKAAQVAAAKKAADAAEAEQAVRALMVPSIEKSVTKMAREHASQGAIGGWPKSTSCSPVAGQSIDNLNKTTTKFSCFVTTEELSGGRARGHYYQALMNWDTGQYTYGYQN